MTRTNPARDMPDAKLFATCTAFRDAYVEWSISDLPKITHYDSFDAAEAKRKVLAKASIDATDVARDIYDDMLEMAVEEYERGIGPAWD